MRKHAYLIIAHNQFELLRMQCGALDSPTHDFYIHIDAKVKDFDFEHFGDFLKYSNVYYVDRVNVSWGGFSMVMAELNLLKAAVGHNYYYYHLLSGQDLPLKSSEEIDLFFEEHEGIEFVHFCDNEFTFGESVQWRVRYYHFLRERIGRREQGFLRLVEWCSLKIQKLLRVDRRKGMQIYCGSQWFSITHRCAEYVLQHAEWIREHFSRTCCADELWLQTLLYASEFRDSIYDASMSGDYHGCMRYVDWERGNPYTWRISDYQQLRGSDYLFARKFDLSVDRDICEKLYRDQIGRCE